MVIWKSKSRPMGVEVASRMKLDRWGEGRDCRADIQ
jgi:hypothetical protein